MRLLVPTLIPHHVCKLEQHSSRWWAVVAIQEAVVFLTALLNHLTPTSLVDVAGHVIAIAPIVDTITRLMRPLVVGQLLVDGDGGIERSGSFHHFPRG